MGHYNRRMATPVRSNADRVRLLSSWMTSSEGWIYGWSVMLPEMSGEMASLLRLPRRQVQRILYKGLRARIIDDAPGACGEVV